MGTVGVDVRPTKSSWTRAASAAAAVGLVAAVIASLTGVFRSSGSTSLRIYADDRVAKGTTSLPPVVPSPSAARPPAADEGILLMGAPTLNRHRLSVSRRKSTVYQLLFCS